MKPGIVFLVGAGPGDAGLITVKGLACIESADVIVYDRLLDERLLEGARHDCEMIYVGKASAEHTMPQADINRLLVEKANQGKTVVRLKGGDPFVLGRGGEEADELFSAGITFEIVPGVTSAVAVPAYAGIPVTHRGISSSFAVITGHEDPSKSNSSIQWHKLAGAVDTYVFLMGMKNLSEITAKLREHGLASDTPAAVIKNGTNPEQITITGTVSDIADRAREAGLSAPVILVVGGVVKMREKLRWFETRPLFGKRILVTRSRHQASALSKLLYERGSLPLELPAIAIEHIEATREMEQTLRSLSRYHWTVFTSVNGVDAFFEQLNALGLDSRALHGVKIAAIGPATAAALESRGVRADFYPQAFTTDGLIEAFGKRNIAGERFLLARTDIVDQELAGGLTGLGAEVDELTVYRTSPNKTALTEAREHLLQGHIDIITFTSSSTVSNLMSAFSGDRHPFAGVTIACIGPKTAHTAAAAGLNPHIVATEHTIPGLVYALEQYFRKGM